MFTQFVKYYKHERVVALNKSIENGPPCESLN